MSTEFKVGDRVVALENGYKDEPDAVLPGARGTVTYVHKELEFPYDVTWDGLSGNYPMTPDEIKAADE